MTYSKDVQSNVLQTSIFTHNLSKDRGKYKGAYTSTIQRNTINRTETGGPQSDSARNPRDPNEKNKATLPQGHRVIEQNLHRSDRAFSIRIKS